MALTPAQRYWIHGKDADTTVTYKPNSLKLALLSDGVQATAAIDVSAKIPSVKALLSCCCMPALLDPNVRVNILSPPRTVRAESFWSPDVGAPVMRGRLTAVFRVHRWGRYEVRACKKYWFVCHCKTVCHGKKLDVTFEVEVTADISCINCPPPGAGSPSNPVTTTSKVTDVKVTPHGCSSDVPTDKYKSQVWSIQSGAAHLLGLDGLCARSR